MQSLFITFSHRGAETTLHTFQPAVHASESEPGFQGKSLEITGPSFQTLQKTKLLTTYNNS